MAGISALAMKATGFKYVKNANLDTGSRTPIGVDNRYSGFVSNIMDDFIDPLVECNQAIKLFGGTETGGVNIGTIRWEWLNNTGKRHKLLIPKSYYVPKGIALEAHSSNRYLHIRKVV